MKPLTPFEAPPLRGPPSTGPHIRWNPLRRTPVRRTALRRIDQNVFPLPSQFSFFPLLGVLSWNFGGVFETLKCARLEFSGCRFKPRRLWGFEGGLRRGASKGGFEGVPSKGGLRRGFGGASKGGFEGGLLWALRPGLRRGVAASKSQTLLEETSGEGFEARLKGMG